MAASVIIIFVFTINLFSLNNGEAVLLYHKDLTVKWNNNKIVGQLKTPGTNWGMQMGYLYRYSKKPALSILLIRLIKSINI